MPVAAAAHLRLVLPSALETPMRICSKVDGVLFRGVRCILTNMVVQIPLCAVFKA
jgi:hypothetical protein